MFGTAKKESRVDRRHFIGGSDARIIMGHDEKALIRLWQEKRGEIGPQDLSGNLIVQLGLATENLNRTWYERNTGRTITAVQTRVRHPVIAFMAATLDGMVAGTGEVYEAKFMLPWSFSEEGAAEKYMAQLQHNMWVINGGASVHFFKIESYKSVQLLRLCKGCIATIYLIRRYYDTDPPPGAKPAKTKTNVPTRKWLHSVTGGSVSEGQSEAIALNGPRRRPIKLPPD